MRTTWVAAQIVGRLALLARHAILRLHVLVVLARGSSPR